MMLKKLLILGIVLAAQAEPFPLRHFYCSRELSKPDLVDLQNRLRSAGYNLEATQGQFKRNKWVTVQNADQAKWALFLIQPERRIHLDIDRESTVKDILDDLRTKLRLSRLSTKTHILNTLSSKRTAILIYHSPENDFKLGEDPMRFILAEVKPHAYLIFHRPKHP